MVVKDITGIPENNERKVQIVTWKEKKDPHVSDALIRFVDRTGFSLAKIGRIIQCDRSVVSKTKRGYRPFAPILARLYILTQEEAFAPSNDHERMVYEKEKASLPQTLIDYLNPSGDDESFKVFSKEDIARAKKLFQELIDIFDMFKKLHSVHFIHL